jgi:hypothetical protein
MSLTIQPTYNHAISSGRGNRVVFTNQALVAIALVAADKVRIVRIAGGTKIDRVVIKTAGDLDSGTGVLTAQIGFEHIDGSTGASLTDVAGTGANALATANATTTYELCPPVTVAKDSYLVITCVVGANAQASAVVVHGKVEGEGLGVA